MNVKNACFLVLFWVNNPNEINQTKNIQFLISLETDIVGKTYYFYHFQTHVNSLVSKMTSKLGSPNFMLI